jgi:hypothetical protein
MAFDHLDPFFTESIGRIMNPGTVYIFVPGWIIGICYMIGIVITHSPGIGESY